MSKEDDSRVSSAFLRLEDDLKERKKEKMPVCMTDGAYGEMGSSYKEMREIEMAESLRHGWNCYKPTYKPITDMDQVREEAIKNGFGADGKRL